MDQGLCRSQVRLPDGRGKLSLVKANAKFGGVLLLATMMLMLCLPHAMAASAPDPTGLLSWWPGEGNANDIAGAQNGTLQGNAGFASGEVGQAFSFDGTNSYVQVPDAPGLDGFSQMTLEAWVKLGEPNTNATGTKFIVSKSDAASQTTGAYALYYGQGLLTAFVNAGGTPVSVSTGFTDTTAFHHVAVTYDGSAVTLYVDGAAQGNAAATGAVGHTPNPFLIGAILFNNTPSNFMNGLVDEVSLYDRALAASEVQAIFNAGAAGKMPPPPGIGRRDVVSINAAQTATDNGTGYGNGLQHSFSQIEATRHTISADGRYVVFTSNASNLGPNDTNGKNDVYRRDRLTGMTALVSINSVGTNSGAVSGNGSSGSVDPSISDDGRYVAFTSDATDLVTGGVATGGYQNIYVRDMQMGVTVLASPAINTGSPAGGNSTSNQPLISGNGLFVAFISSATNLTAIPVSGNDIYVRDLMGNTTALVTINKDGSAGAGGAQEFAISDDGKSVAFSDTAANLVATDTNGQQDVFVRNLTTNTTSLVSANSGNTDSGNNFSEAPTISADGLKVAFLSTATNLVTGVTFANNYFANVYVRNVQSGTTTLVSVDPAGANSSDNSSFEATISGNGQFVAFSSSADNLQATPTNGSTENIFKRDLQGATTTLVSVNNAGTAGGGSDSFLPTISADGRFVAFGSGAQDLIAGGSNNQENVFVRDTQAQTTALASVNGVGTNGGNGASYTAIISSGGQGLAFESNATDLGSGVADTNGILDIFAVTVLPGTPPPPPTPSTLQFSAPTYSIIESGGQATITVTRIGSTGGTATVDYGTIDSGSDSGTAVSGTDYTSVFGTLTFAAGETSKTFSVPILDNATPQPNRTITLGLADPTGSGASLGNPNRAVLTIVDDDPAGVLQFDTSSYNAGEGQYAVVNVVRSSGSNGTVTVDYATSDGTAKAGTDYITAMGTLTFAPGETNKQIIVQTPNVPGYQGNRSFSILLSNATGFATIGAQNAATITITEAEQPPVAVPVGTLQFSSSAYSVAENVLGNQIVVYVTRSTASLTPVTVNYSTADGTATAGTDYTATSGSLTFNNGDQQLYFFVPIANLPGYKGNRSFSVALSNPTGGASLGTPNTATVTILETDPVPVPVYPGAFQFSTPSFSVNEDGSGDGSGANGTAEITVQRTGGSDGTVEVGVAIGGQADTAVLGTHYNLPTAANLPLGSVVNSNVVTLVFGPGETSKIFSLPIIDSRLAETAPRTVQLSLFNPSGGATLVAGNLTTVLNIHENHAPPAITKIATASATSTTPITTVAQGQTFAYQFTYKNLSTVAASNVLINDVVPVGTALLSGVGDTVSFYGYTPGSAVVLGIKGPVAPGATKTVSFTVQAMAAAGTVITNPATKYSVSASNLSQPVAGDHDVNVTVASALPSQLAISKTASSPTIFENGVLTYTLTYTNKGGAVTNAVITDKIPAFTTYVAFSASEFGVFTTATNTVKWTLPSIAAGTAAHPATGTVSYSVTVGTVAHTPVVNDTYSIQAIGDPAVTGAAVRTTIVKATPAKLSIVKHALASASSTTYLSTVRPGQIYYYVLTYRNDGDSPVNAGLITDDIPTGTTYQDGTAAGDAVQSITFNNVLGSDTIGFKVGAVPGHTVASVRFAVQVGFDTATGTHIDNPEFSYHLSATTTSGATLLVEGGNDVNLTVAGSVAVARPILGILNVAYPPNVDGSKPGAPTLSSVQPGEQIGYYIGFQNHVGAGGGVAKNVSITDDVPQFTTVVPGSISDGGQLVTVGTQQRIVWQGLGDLGPNSPHVVHFAVQVAANAPTTGPQAHVINRNLILTATNLATGVTAANVDTPIVEPPHLFINKSADKSTATNVAVAPGSTITYTLNYGNGATGSLASAVVVSDVLPTGTTFVSATRGGTFNASTKTVTYQVGNLAAGASGSVQLVVKVAATATAGSVITNAASSYHIKLSSASGVGQAGGASVTTTVALAKRNVVVFENASNIWLIGTDGKGLTQLTTDGQSHSPDLSRDGRRIAYQRLLSGGRNPVSQIWVMNSDGTNQRAVTSTNDFTYGDNPRWDPVDNNTLAAQFMAANGPHTHVFQIYLLNVVSGGFTQVTGTVEHSVVTQPALPGAGGANIVTPEDVINNPAASNNYQPSWSPDGTQIVFATDRVLLQNTAVANGVGIQVGDVYRINVATRTETRVTQDQNLSPQQTISPSPYPAWDPAGAAAAQVIALTGYASRNDGPRFSAIYLVKANGVAQSTEMLLFSDDNESEDQPAWSPDGGTLAFVQSPGNAGSGGVNNIMLYNISTKGDPQRITTGTHPSLGTIGGS